MPNMIPPNFLETPLALSNENCWPNLGILTESTSEQKGQGTERALCLSGTAVARTPSLSLPLSPKNLSS